MNLSRDHHTQCTFIPPWLAERVATAAQAAHDESLRRQRAVTPPAELRAGPAHASNEPAWQVHDAASTTTLPGTPVRGAGDPETGDLAVDEASAGIEATLSMFADALGRASYDDEGAQVVLTVHYGSDYDNAFWDGTQLVFGDGDGRIFERFTKPVDVLAHEFGHAVVQHTANLTYAGQSGALNESVADAFAACLKQRELGQDAAAGDWLIGEGIFTPAVHARALRDMAAPGTAFDDEVLGRDPQVGHMDDYVDGTADHGGVHINSGIPNRAFQLAAVGIGGSSIEGAGQVWYAALTSGAVGPDSDFGSFAGATVEAAGEHADVVRRAWEAVGVTPLATVPASSDRRGGPSVLRVQRSGGFAGRTTANEVDLSGDDPSLAQVRDLLARTDFSRAKAGTPHPDMFVFEFQVDDDEPIRVPEQNLTDDLSALAGAVLRHDPRTP